MTEANEKNDVDDGPQHQNDGLSTLLPKSRRSLLGFLLFVVMLVTFRSERRDLNSLDFHYHDDQYQNLATFRSERRELKNLDNDIVIPSNESKVAHSSSARPIKNYLMYVVTLQGVEGAASTNAGRYDQFQRHWEILCHHDGNNQERIHFHKCPGYLNPKGSPGGFGLSMAYSDCFRWTLKHHKQWHKEHNPNATEGLDDDSIPFVFLEDDARLYNSNFCYSEYRNRLWKSLPQTNATLLMLGGHHMKFSNKSHPVARSYQDYFYNESILMDPSVLPQIVRPGWGAGSYGFALLNTPTVEYMTRKMNEILNRTRGFKAIDRQIHCYEDLMTVMSYPWLVYHEGGIYSNTKHKVRGEFGGGSKQYRWIDGLTGSAKNCTSNGYDTDGGKKNQADVTSGLSIRDDHDHFQEGTVVVSCRTVTFRMPNSLPWKNNSTFAAGTKKKIPTAIVSSSSNAGIRASIRSTWGRNSSDKFFLVAGPWEEIVSEFQEHGDLVWVNLPENGNNDSNADSSTMVSTLQVASLLMLAETQYGNNYSHILKVTDHSYANLRAIRSQLVDEDQESVAMWGSNCGTGVRPSHVGVPETEYSDFYFPQYCRGEGYALSKFFVQCAVAQIPHSRLVSLDDAYIGILGERCGLQENQFHSGADVEKGKVPLLQHGLPTPDAMEKYHARWLNVPSDSEHL